MTIRDHGTIRCLRNKLNQYLPDEKFTCSPDSTWFLYLINILRRLVPLKTMGYF